MSRVYLVAAVIAAFARKRLGRRQTLLLTSSWFSRSRA